MLCRERNPNLAASVARALLGMLVRCLRAWRRLPRPADHSGAFIDLLPQRIAVRLLAIQRGRAEFLQTDPRERGMTWAPVALCDVQQAEFRTPRARPLIH